MIKNIPQKKDKFANLINIKEHCIMSMQCSDSESASLTLLAIAAGESISEEEYSEDTMFYLLSGKLIIKTERGKNTLIDGDVLLIKRHTLHSLYAVENVKLMQLSI